ncbi:MAG: AraC family transcriptional regulator [Steroidobacteraceae bacterium]
MNDYQVRAAGFEGYSALVRELGGDPDALLRQAGVNPDWLDDPEYLAPYLSFLAALRLASRATATPHFGLLLSRKQRFSMLGAVGFAVREAPDVQAAIENLNRFLPVHSPALSTKLVVERDLARWTADILQRDAPALDQQLDLAAGVGVSLLRHLAGHDWAPLSVNLKRAEPKDSRPYRQLFRCPVSFDADFTGLVFHRKVLSQPVANADQQLFRILHQYLTQLEARAPSDFGSLVRETVALTLQDGDSSIDAVASRLGLSERTLQRRLHAAGLNYKDILVDVRRSIAQQYLRDTGVSLTQISTILGYSDLAAFSRSFQRQFGVSPRKWRQARLG